MDGPACAAAATAWWSAGRRRDPPLWAVSSSPPPFSQNTVGHVPAGQGAGHRAEPGPGRVPDQPDPPAAEVVRDGELVGIAGGEVGTADPTVRPEPEPLVRPRRADIEDD